HLSLTFDHGHSQGNESHPREFCLNDLAVDEATRGTIGISHFNIVSGRGDIRYDTIDGQDSTKPGVDGFHALLDCDRGTVHALDAFQPRPFRGLTAGSSGLHARETRPKSVASA